MARYSIGLGSWVSGCGSLA